MRSFLKFEREDRKKCNFSLCVRKISYLCLRSKTGAQDLLTKIFVGKKFCVMSPLEAELTKYMHNVFGAYKVTYFNACKEYCEQMGGDWRKVHIGMLLSGYINDTHTYVPGPDGKFGYGGKCFPKDVNAFAKMTAGTPLGTLLEQLHELNVHFRGVEEHI